MAKITVKSVLFEQNKYAGAAGVEHSVGITLSESPDFQNVSEYKYGVVPITCEGKVASADAAGNCILQGFMAKDELQSLSDLYPMFPKTGDEIAMVSVATAIVDTAKAAGTPVYLGDDTFYNDTAGTVTVPVGRYVNYKPTSVGLSNGAGLSYVVEFDVNLSM